MGGCVRSTQLSSGCIPSYRTFDALLVAIIDDPLFRNVERTNGARADGYVMPKILPDFDSCDRGARCPGELDKLERRADDTEDVIRER